MSLRTPRQFAVVAGKERTAWNMQDGRVMTGILVQNWGVAFTVVRPDGTTCRVPAEKCRPATLDDFESSIEFFAALGR